METRADAEVFSTALRYFLGEDCARDIRMQKFGQGGGFGVRFFQTI